MTIDDLDPIQFKKDVRYIRLLEKRLVKKSEESKQRSSNAERSIQLWRCFVALKMCRFQISPVLCISFALIPRPTNSHGTMRRSWSLH